MSDINDPNAFSLEDSILQENAASTETTPGAPASLEANAPQPSGLLDRLKGFLATKKGKIVAAVLGILVLGGLATGAVLYGSGGDFKGQGVGGGMRLSEEMVNEIEEGIIGGEAGSENEVEAEIESEEERSPNSPILKTGDGGARYDSGNYACELIGMGCGRIEVVMINETGDPVWKAASVSQTEYPSCLDSVNTQQGHYGNGKTYRAKCVPVVPISKDHEDTTGNQICMSEADRRTCKRIEEFSGNQWVGSGIECTKRVGEEMVDGIVSSEKNYRAFCQLKNNEMEPESAPALFAPMGVVDSRVGDAPAYNNEVLIREAGLDKEREYPTGDAACKSINQSCEKLNFLSDQVKGNGWFDYANGLQCEDDLSRITSGALPEGVNWGIKAVCSTNGVVGDTPAFANINTEVGDNEVLMKEKEQSRKIHNTGVAACTSLNSRCKGVEFMSNVGNSDWFAYAGVECDFDISRSGILPEASDWAIKAVCSGYESDLDAVLACGRAMPPVPNAEEVGEFASCITEIVQGKSDTYFRDLDEAVIDRFNSTNQFCQISSENILMMSLPMYMSHANLNEYYNKFNNAFFKGVYSACDGKISAPYAIEDRITQSEAARFSQYCPKDSYFDAALNKCIPLINIEGVEPYNIAFYNVLGLADEPTPALGYECEAANTLELNKDEATYRLVQSTKDNLVSLVEVCLSEGRLEARLDIDIPGAVPAGQIQGNGFQVAGDGYVPEADPDPDPECRANADCDEGSVCIRGECELVTADQDPDYPVVMKEVSGPVLYSTGDLACESINSECEGLQYGFIQGGWLTSTSSCEEPIVEGVTPANYRFRALCAEPEEPASQCAENEIEVGEDCIDCIALKGGIAALYGRLGTASVESEEALQAAKAAFEIEWVRITPEMRGACGFTQEDLDNYEAFDEIQYTQSSQDRCDILKGQINALKLVIDEYENVEITEEYTMTNLVENLVGDLYLMQAKVDLLPTIEGCTLDDESIIDYLPYSCDDYENGLSEYAAFLDDPDTMPANETEENIKLNIKFFVEMYRYEHAHKNKTCDIDTDAYATYYAPPAPVVPTCNERKANLEAAKTGMNAAANEQEFNLFKAELVTELNAAKALNGCDVSAYEVYAQKTYVNCANKYDSKFAFYKINIESAQSQASVSMLVSELAKEIDAAKADSCPVAADVEGLLTYKLAAVTNCATYESDFTTLAQLIQNAPTAATMEAYKAALEEKITDAEEVGCTVPVHLIGVLAAQYIAPGVVEAIPGTFQPMQTMTPVPTIPTPQQYVAAQPAANMGMNYGAQGMASVPQGMVPYATIPANTGPETYMYLILFAGLAFAGFIAQKKGYLTKLK